MDSQSHTAGFSTVATLRCRDRIFENIQAIVFDKDGTLAEVESYLKSLGQKRARLVDAKIPGVQEPLLLAFGLEASGVSPMGLLAVGSRRENEIAAAAYVAETGRDWAEAVAIAAAAFQEAESYLKPKAVHTPLLPNLGDSLSQLAQSGLKLGILSADTTAHIKEFVETYQLSSSIAAYQGDDGEGMSKPDPKLYELICRQLNVSPEQTVMIGDSTLDMKMARAAGSAGCVGVTWGWKMPVAIAQATCILDRPEDLQVFREGV
ncbi:HAD family hydrolase [Altericista sp. CCNU0014]|uniref:HAD family hydrolase n=1 Tax=Altericista sp. CCNU0014 TaxID=3082949 RepID=UPI0038511DF5